MKHVFNLLKLANKMGGNKKYPNIYYHLNLAFKGIVGQLDEDALKEVKKVLQDEHKKTITFIDKLIKDGKKAEQENKAA